MDSGEFAPSCTQCGASCPYSRTNRLCSFHRGRFIARVSVPGLVAVLSGGVCASCRICSILARFFTGLNFAWQLFLFPAACLRHSRRSVRVALRVVGSPSIRTRRFPEVRGRGFCCRSRYLRVSGLGTRFHRVRGHRPLETCKSPWSLRGSRGYVPHGYMGLMAGHAACCTPYISHSSLVPVQRRSIELPATAVVEWRRRHFLQSHKEGLLTIPLTSCHLVLFAGWFF